MARIPKRTTIIAILVAIASLLLWSDAGLASAHSHRHLSGPTASGKAPRGHRPRADRRRRVARHRGRRVLRRKHHPATASVRSAVAVSSGAKATTSSSLLFDGSHVSDFWVDHSAAGAITEPADPLGSGEDVLQMNVHNSDVYPITPTENPRAELLSPDILESGEEFWLSTKFMIPTDMPSVPGWLSLVSLYGPPFEGASPWHVAIDENTLRWQRNETYGYDIPWEAPLIEGRWVTVLAHERLASDGWVEMWIDGQQITFFGGDTYNPNHVGPTPRLEMQTMDASNGGGPNSAKIMQYREAGMFEDASVYFGALKLGTTRASVEG